MERIAAAAGIDLVVSALAGSVGLIPTLKAIDAGRDVALANKEVLVMAGELVLEQARRTGSKLLPVDSELSAIFQAMAGHCREEVRRILLTASGGPFLGWSKEQLATVMPEKALGHPNWSMGSKVTLDSATLMNKGLEVIETRWLFDIPAEKIEVHIHPQSIVHSMVEYWDGSVLAQMGIPDMRIPIAYALSYPQRMQNTLPPLNLLQVRELTFLPPDRDAFPCLELAYRALKQGGTYPAVLNAANEVAGQAFLAGRIRFHQISSLVERSLETHIGHPIQGLEDVIEADGWTRKECARWIDGV
jgi:1-deoxy-D-xylulose-5-phosphate reductoisomerase